MGTRAVTAATGREIRGPGTDELRWQSWDGLRRLPQASAGELVPAGSRALVLAPHPDDELLGCGGLIRQLVALRREVIVLAVTDGAASHPHSTLWPAARLARERPRESLRALRRLGAGSVRVERLGLDDGRIGEQAQRLDAALDRIVLGTDVLVSTWRLDGHPDHEASGRAAAQAAARHGAALLEMPVWMWHWAAAGDTRVPWERACRLGLDDDSHAAKCAAVEAYRSQLSPDPTTGSGPVVAPGALARLMRREEVYFR